jgi:hypothetical protein
MVLKSFDYSVIDEPKAGVYVHSQNGVDWFYPSGGPKAYSLTVTWEDGTTTVLDRLERPQVLQEGGKPAYIFLAAKYAAASDAPYNGISFNVVIPVGKGG